MNTSFKPKKRIKIAIITNIPTPYRKKQWEYYSNCEYLDITIFYCANTEESRFWNVNPSKGVKEVFLNGITFKSFHFNPGVLKIVFNDFDIFFVGGYGYPSVIMSIFALRFLKKPWIMINDGISPLKLEKQSFILEKIKKFLTKGAGAYFANGTVGAKSITKYGISSEKIFNQYMTVDVDYLIKKEKDSTKSRNEIRQKYVIDENSVVVMYAGRLIENKGIHDLIEAIKLLKNMNINIRTLIVGEGNFRLELERQSKDISDNVIFTGHINSEELYKYYYASDIFVLPTYDDKWGLVVNEAMACRLPVIVTDAAGCSLDLIKNNGYIVKSHNAHELAIAIEKITKNRVKFGSNSRKIILEWTYKESLKSFFSAIKWLLDI